MLHENSEDYEFYREKQMDILEELQDKLMEYTKKARRVEEGQKAMNEERVVREKELGRVRKEWKTEIEKNNRLYEMVMDAERDVRRREELMDEMTMNLEELKMDKQELTRMNGSISEELKEMKKEMESLFKTLRETKKENDSLKNDVTTKNSTIAQLDLNVSNLIGELDLIRTKMGRVEEEGKELIKDNETLRDDVKKERDNSLRIESELRDQLEDLMSKIATRQNSESEWEKKVNEMKITLLSVEESKAHLSENCNRLEKEKESLKEEGNCQRGRLVEMEAKLSKCEKEKEEKMSELKKTKENLVKLESERSDFWDQLKNMEKKCEKFENEAGLKNDELEEGLREFCEKKERLLREKEDLEGRVSEKREELMEMKNCLRASEEKVESLEKQLEKSMGVKSELERRLSVICNEIGESLGNVEGGDYCLAVRRAGEKERRRLEEGRNTKKRAREGEDRTRSIECRLKRLQSTLSKVWEEKSRLEWKVEECEGALAKKEKELKMNQRHVRNCMTQLAEQEMRLKDSEHEKEMLMERVHFLGVRMSTPDIRARDLEEYQRTKEEWERKWQNERERRLEEVEQRMLPDKQPGDYEQGLKAHAKAEKLLHTKDRVYKQRVSTLQEQVAHLKAELDREIRHKQGFKRQSSVPPSTKSRV